MSHAFIGFGSMFGCARTEERFLHLKGRSRQSPLSRTDAVQSLQPNNMGWLRTSALVSRGARRSLWRALELPPSILLHHPAPPTDDYVGSDYVCLACREVDEPRFVFIEAEAATGALCHMNQNWPSSLVARMKQFE